MIIWSLERSTDFMAVSQKPFAFNVSYYTQEELTEKAHNLNWKIRQHCCLSGLWAEWNQLQQLRSKVSAKNNGWIKKRFTFEMMFIWKGMRGTHE